MKRMSQFLYAATIIGCCATSPAWAEPPVVTDVRIVNGTAHVTLTHGDTGWDHYADVWRIYTPEGTLLAERILAHPHVNEQPFTRSTRLTVPIGLRQIHVVAACNQGDHSERFILDLALN